MSRSGAIEFDQTRLSFVEHHIAKISSARHAFAVTSGMGALDVIFRLLKPGDNIIAGNDLYGGSNRLIGYLKEHNGITTHHVDTTKPSSFLPILQDPNQKVAMVLLETPTNPLLQIADIEAIAQLVKRYKQDAIIVVDNTMMSPYLARPLELGADIVYDSGTKYLSGHHDLMAGVICCDRDEIAKVCFLHRNWQNLERGAGTDFSDFRIRASHSPSTRSETPSLLSTLSFFFEVSRLSPSELTNSKPTLS